MRENGKTTFHDALTHHLQITRLNRKIVKEYATKGKCATLLDLLVPEQQEPLRDTFMTAVSSICWSSIPA